MLQVMNVRFYTLLNITLLVDFPAKSVNLRPPGYPGPDELAYRIFAHDAHKHFFMPGQMRPGTYDTHFPPKDV